MIAMCIVLVVIIAWGLKKEGSRRKNTGNGKKSRTIANQKASMVLKLNVAELCLGGIVP